MHHRAVTSPSSLQVVTRIFLIISEKNEHQLDQKANTHSRIWIFDDLPYVYFILGHFGQFTVQFEGYLSQIADAAIASVL